MIPHFAILYVFLFFLFVLPLLGLSVVLVIKYTICIVVLFIKLVGQWVVMDIELSKLQSIFQLGAALMAASTVAYPQVRSWLTRTFAHLDLLDNAVSGIQSGVTGCVRDCMVVRKDIISMLRDISELTTINVEQNNTWQYIWVLSFFVINLILLVFSSYYAGCIPVYLAVLLTMIALLPPFLVPLDALLVARRLDGYIVSVMTGISSYEKRDNLDALKAIAAEVALRKYDLLKQSFKFS